MKNKERHQKTLSDRVIAKLKQIASQRAEAEQRRNTAKANKTTAYKAIRAEINSQRDKYYL